MAVPYGFGVGDFITVGTLAWNVYKSCKDAPENFGNISGEVLSFHAVIKEAEETVFEQDLSQDKTARLKVIIDGCYSVLKDLDAVMKKYESLGTQSKRTWVRLKWSTEDVAELRARITSHSTMLSTFIATSQIKVEQKLGRFLEEWHQGKRDGSAISSRTLDSLSRDDQATWRGIRKQLEDIGISIAAFDANREYIFDWFLKEIDSGAFNEEPDGKPLSGDNPIRSKAGESPTSPQNARLEEASVANFTSPDTTASTYLKDGDGDLTSNGVFGNENRLSLLASRLRNSRIEKQLCDFVNKHDKSSLIKMLSKYAAQGRLDNGAMTSAVAQAARSGDYEVLDILFEYGASLNVPKGQKSPLIEAVDGCYPGLVDELRAKGADLNHQAQFLHFHDNLFTSRHLSALVTAIGIGDYAMTSKLLLARADAGQKLWDRREEFFITALHYAACCNQSSVILDILLKSGVDVDTPSSFGTPLAFSFAAERKDDALQLCDNGAQVGLQFWDEDLKRTITPMHVAIACQRSEEISYCLEHGFKPTLDLLTWTEELATGVQLLPRVTRFFPLYRKKRPRDTYLSILTLLKDAAKYDLITVGFQMSVG